MSVYMAIYDNGLRCAKHRRWCGGTVYSKIGDCEKEILSNNYEPWGDKFREIELTSYDYGYAYVKELTLEL